MISRRNNRRPETHLRKWLCPVILLSALLVIGITTAVVYCGYVERQRNESQQSESSGDPDRVPESSEGSSVQRPAPQEAASKKPTLLEMVKSKLTQKPKRPAVLVTTGSLSPVHVSHVSNIDAARDAAEKLGYTVLAGVLSPSSDVYLKNKHENNLKHGQPGVWISAEHRLAMAKLAVSGSDYICVGTYETSSQCEADYQSAWAEYWDITKYYYELLNSNTKHLRPNGEAITVIYLCGADHYNNYISRHGGFREHVGKRCHVNVDQLKVVAAVPPRKEKDNRGKIFVNNPDIPKDCDDFLVPCTPSDLSSSEVRKLLVAKFSNKNISTAQENRLSAILAPKVFQYVSDNHKDVLKWLQ